jgi:hypothetical protein
LAMVIPIPLEEPVMIITFPFNLFIYDLFFIGFYQLAANVKYKKRRAVKKHFRFGLLLS